jgi:G3E family GTPase
VAQVEGASLIVLNKADRIDARELETVVELLRALNPSARLVTTSFARVSRDTLLSRTTTETQETHASEPSAKRARANGEAAAAADDGACFECGPPGREAAHRSGALLGRRVRAAVTSFTYARDRPFHPLRLHERVIQCLPTQRAAGTSLSASADAAGAAVGFPFAHLLRSKGFAWLASQPQSRFAWAYAGCHFTLLEHSEWPAGAAVAQALEFIGLALDEDEVCARLDGCLLADWEMDYFRRGEVPPAEAPALAGGRAPGET